MNMWNWRKQIPEHEWLVDQEYVRTEYVLNQYLEYWHTEPAPEVPVRTVVRRPNADAFEDLTPIDESTLIDKSQLLDPIADNDDIDWKTDPFEMRPDSVNFETPDEIIVMIIFSDSPWLQEQLTSFCSPCPHRSNQWSSKSIDKSTAGKGDYKKFCCFCRLG